MKITRGQIRRLIEAEIFDFEKERRKRRTPEDREKEDRELAQSAVSGDSEDDWVYDVEGEIELLMRGIESGEVVDLADSDPFDDDPMTESGDTAYSGELGIGTSTGDSSGTRQDIEDEVENTTSQINALGSSTSDQQQKKVLQDQLRMLQQKLSSM